MASEAREAGNAYLALVRYSQPNSLSNCLLDRVAKYQTTAIAVRPPGLASSELDGISASAVA